MMRMKTKPSQMRNGENENDWEMRPCGMLVQKRNPDSDNRPPPPTIRVRVKYASVYHQINISSQATFGELKKMLTGPTGLHHQDQKLLFKDKERGSNAFLDICGVKDKSKVVLIEDPISQEKRYVEMRKNAKMEKAAKTVSEISLEVDRLGGQVSALESVISRGGKVEEKTLINLVELLMNQLLKLDAIVAEGDVKLQRKMQVKRVQKYVESLDMLKIKNSSVTISNGDDTSKGNHTPKQNNNPCPPQKPGQYGYLLDDESPIKQQQARHSASSGHVPVVITTHWETFDSAVSTTSNTTTSSAHHHPGFSWNLL